MASSSAVATASDVGDDQCDVHHQPTIVNDANKAVIIRYLDQMVYDTSVLTALIDRICTLLMQSLSPTHNNYDSASDDAPITDSGDDIDVASIDTEQQQQPSVIVEEKIALPEPRPGFSAIGRLIGPRGLTVRQLELDTGCRIAVHGKGSVKDPQRETYLCNRPGWEHLIEPLHVLVSAKDTTHSGAEYKLQRAIADVTRVITPSPRNDHHKRRQLVQLAIINGTYRA